MQVESILKLIMIRVNKKYVDDLVEHSGGFNPNDRIDFKAERSLTTKGTIEVGVDDLQQNPQTILNADGSIITKSIMIDNTTISSNENHNLTIDNTLKVNNIEITNGKISEILDDDLAIVNKKYVNEHGGIDPNERVDLKAIDYSLTTKGGILIGYDEITEEETAFITKDGILSINNGYVAEIDETTDNIDLSIINKGYVDNKLFDINTRLETAEGNISTNTSNINGLSTRLETAESNISTNTGSINGYLLY